MIGEQTIPDDDGSEVGFLDVLNRLPGASGSCLVKGDDGLVYVAKLFPNPRGVNILRNEFVATRIMRGLGISVPRVALLRLTKDDVAGLERSRHFPSASELPRPGLHFASECNTNPQYQQWDGRLSDGIAVENPNDFVRMYLFDLWAMQVDRRQIIYRRDICSWSVTAFFIDNSHLFGGPSLEADNACFVAQSYCGVPHPSRGDLQLRTELHRFKRDIPALLLNALYDMPAEWNVDDLQYLEMKLMFRLLNLAKLVDAEYKGQVLNWPSSEWGVFNPARVSVVGRHRSSHLSANAY